MMTKCSKIRLQVSVLSTNDPLVRYFLHQTTDGETIVISKGDHYWHTLCMLRIMHEEYDDRKTSSCVNFKRRPLLTAGCQ